MKYEKPKYDCGEFLIFAEEVSCYSNIKINKDGTLSKHKTKLLCLGGTELQKLECQSCNNIYDFHYDSKGRLTRGELLK